MKLYLVTGSYEFDPVPCKVFGVFSSLLLAEVAKLNAEESGREELTGGADHYCIQHLTLDKEYAEGA